ncbi:sigma 54-interacting transcriptional regulator [Calycomorphotria hydatis]|uniref:Sigma-54 interaction domain protein n=1 Tax=Calycomorphotria hydatis TaxID=2528027 RepID=A0A517T491_9PLAN|nr:sigma 54-interacting transcriptional regulator [Calycomorphotria hydatis]QDT63190.1 Sigma-54 interaction domain protein [Calycomorphotria hydatis]
MSHSHPATLGELKASGYRSESVKAEMRRNLIAKLKAGEDILPGIRGYEETVLPQIQNAILSRHDMLFLGLRGQGKTRMLRMLVNLLDETTPIVAGSEIHDDPLHPVSKYARDMISSRGDSTPIEWISRDDRYHEKLATPDVTIADLIGEVDLIKHAEGKHLASEDVMHFGLIPRSHRGIFCMNELPDLSPKIQVGLFNVLEERDVQIRGFSIRLPLDICVVFSANPEDYTNRGRIVTPLKDRIGSVIRTHYPLTRELGMQITEENAWTERDSEVSVLVPDFVSKIVEETSRLARTSPHVNQASGVSVRMSITNYENLLSNAERRAIVAGEDKVVARISDLAYAAAGSRGKMELAMSEEPGDEDKLLYRIIDEAVKNVFDESLKPKAFRNVVEYVESGKSLVIGDQKSTDECLQQIDAVPGFRKALDSLTEELSGGKLDSALRPQFVVAMAEFVLDALYAHNRLNKHRHAGSMSYGI